MSRLILLTKLILFLLAFANASYALEPYKANITGIQVSQINEIPHLMLRVEQINYKANLNSCVIYTKGVTVQGSELYVDIDFEACSRVMYRPHKTKWIAVRSDLIPEGEYMIYLEGQPTRKINKVSEHAYRLVNQE